MRPIATTSATLSPKFQLDCYQGSPYDDRRFERLIRAGVQTDTNDLSADPDEAAWYRSAMGKGLRWAADYDDQRPRLIMLFNSSEVKLGGGLLLKRPGFWTVHICYSHDVLVDGLTIRANDETVHDGGRNGHGPSTDGVYIDSSRKITVAHVDIENNDDAICLKAGRDFDGLRVNRPTEDVVIRDSVIRVGAAGVTFGSETSGLRRAFSRQGRREG